MNREQLIISIMALSPVVAYLLYKVGLELWCIMYGLLY